ncbi:MAG: transposase [Bacteroidota bacterium]
MSNLDYQFHWQRHLPHFQPKEVPIFLTLCLWNRHSTHPKQSERDQALSIDRFFDEDYILDSNIREGPLVAIAVASICRTYLHCFDAKLYELLTYVIMPDHLHIILKPGTERGLPVAVSAIMHRLKMHIAYYANRQLGRRGRFWQQEYFDRVIDSEKKYQKIAQYIYENPLRAGLVGRAEDWPWYYHYQTDGRA